MVFKLETNVPMPELPRNGRTIYPFRQMNVGDSFFAPIDDDDRLSRDRLASAASYAGSRNNMKFARRRVDGGYRIWRLS
jgi:hypothetical protein